MNRMFEKQPNTWKKKALWMLVIGYVLTSLVVLVFLVSDVTVWKRKYDGLSERLERSNDSLRDVNRLLRELIVADDYYFDGELQSSYDLLQRLHKNENNYFDPLFEKRVLDRMTILNEFFGTPDTTDSRVRTLLMVITDKEMELRTLRASNDSVFAVFQDTLVYFSEKFNSMRTELSDKQRQLALKDRIKVLTFNTSKGARIHYLGEIREEKANGGGVGIWSTGSIYRGDWKENKRHGKGNFEWPNGHIYQGDYLDDRREGLGAYIWPSGEKYDGEWKDDKRNGFGTLYDLDGNIQYEGQWENDKIKN